MKKLDEASRNELLYMVKSQHGDRYNRASGYKGFSVQNIDTTNLLKSNTLVVVCRVGDHNTVVELEDVLYWIEMSAEYNNQNQINTKGITQALMNSIDGMDIKVDCDCGDWVYRFSNMATILGYKYGKQEYRPNRYKRTNNQHHGSVCKHLTAILSNKRWLQQVTSTLMDWVEQNIDKVNKFLNRKKGNELTLPNELARQNAKKSWQNRRARQEEPVEEPEETNDINDIENTEDNVDNKLPQNVQGNNPSTNKVNGLDNGENDEEN